MHSYTTLRHMVTVLFFSYLVYWIGVILRIHVYVHLFSLFLLHKINLSHTLYLCGLQGGNMLLVFLTLSNIFPVGNDQGS